MAGAKNTNYTKQQINGILREIKSLVKIDRWTLSTKYPERKKNIDFQIGYCMNEKLYTGIINDLCAENFCYSIKNDNPNYPDDDLYIFSIQKELMNFQGDFEDIEIYIKGYITVFNDGNRVIFISFHELEESISFLFQ